MAAARRAGGWVLGGDWDLRRNLSNCFVAVLGCRLRLRFHAGIRDSQRFAWLVARRLVRALRETRRFSEHTDECLCRASSARTGARLETAKWNRAAARSVLRLLW